MKFISESEAKWISRKTSFLIKYFNKKNLIQLIIILLFIPVWSNIVFDGVILLPDFFLVVYAVLPFILLGLILIYRNYIAYMVIISITFYSLLLNFSSLLENISNYLNDVSFYGYIPIEAIQGNLEMLCISFILMALLHNNRITRLYKWTFRSFVISGLSASLWFFGMRLLFIVLY